MKAMLLLLVAGILAVGVISTSAAEPPETRSPDLPWYYQSPCQQPKGVSLHDWLGNLEQHGQLKDGGWDCSQTSAYVEWLCENCGHDAVITCRLPTDAAVGHCWVVVEGNPYEATSLQWIDSGTYEADLWFQDIYEAWAYTQYGKLGEWGWWVTYPELVP